MDVPAFWAQHEMETHQHEPSSNCELCGRPPRVYIYELSPPWSDWSPGGATLLATFGRSVGWGGRLRESNQYGFAQMLHYRLNHSTVYCTEDPLKVRGEGMLKRAHLQFGTH